MLLQRSCNAFAGIQPFARTRELSPSRWTAARSSRSLSRSLITSGGQDAHGKILSGLFICISGKHSRGTHKEIQAEITDAGGTNISNARGNCTTLVTTPQEVKKPTRKISDARVLGIPIVSEDWLAACLREVEQVDISAYLLEGWPLAPSTGGTLCNPTHLFASGNEVRFFQATVRSNPRSTTRPGTTASTARYSGNAR